MITLQEFSQLPEEAKIYIAGPDPECGYCPGFREGFPNYTELKEGNANHAQALAWYESMPSVDSEEGQAFLKGIDTIVNEALGIEGEVEDVVNEALGNEREVEEASVSYPEDLPAQYNEEVKKYEAYGTGVGMGVKEAQSNAVDIISEYETLGPYFNGMSQGRSIGKSDPQSLVGYSVNGQ